MKRQYKYAELYSAGVLCSALRSGGYDVTRNNLNYTGWKPTVSCVRSERVDASLLPAGAGKRKELITKTVY